MNNPQRLLESKMVKYKDLLQISVKESLEKFTKIDNSVLPNGYLNGMTDMRKLFGPRVLVRNSVLEKLIDAQKLLKLKNKDYSLFVMYGYRTLEIQTGRFLKQLQKTTNVFFSDPAELYEEIHRFIAVPTVAGHPTGGAIDIMINDTRSNKLLIFGSEPYDYSTKNCYVFAKNISQEARKNRMLLRSILVKCGFAPFDGEWWHFSYGDREWACYYKKKFAIYSQIESKKVKL